MPNTPSNPLQFLNIFLPKRLVVLKTVSLYGDGEEKDQPLATQLCLDKFRGSITQEEFDKRYRDASVRLVSGPAIEFNVQTEIDERRKVLEPYTERVSVPSYSNGVAMNDGNYITVQKQREVVKGKVRHLDVQCTAFEYHF